MLVLPTLGKAKTQLFTSALEGGRWMAVPTGLLGFSEAEAKYPMGVGDDAKHLR